LLRFLAHLLAVDAADPTEREVNATQQRDLRAMISDGVAFSAMVGFGESYLPAFTLALGFGAVTSGLIGAVPMLAGAVLQLVTPAAVGLLRSHRRWVVLCAGLQAASFLPLIAGALAESLPLLGLYLAASLYWGFGMSTGPAWTAWATTIVPAASRARFFARRAAASQISLVVSLLAAGGLLQLAAPRDRTMWAYAALFTLAFVLRLISAQRLWSQSEPQPVPIGETRISPTLIRRHIEIGGHGRLLVFLLCFQLSVWIAAPYFTPYMLDHLGLRYADFTLLTTSAFGARVIALPRIARAMDRLGTRRVLSVSALGIVPLPALWLLSDSLWWLYALQVLSGVAWAAFELGTLLTFFERIPPHGQTSVLTVYNLANAGAIALGSLLGGALMKLIEPSASAFVVLMLVSTVCRALALPLLRSVEAPRRRAPIAALRTLSARPSSGALQRPVLVPPEAPAD
jgi:MFS family permease